MTILLPSATKGTNNGVFAGGLPEREGLTAGFFIPEIAPRRSRRSLFTSTAGDGCEPAKNIASGYREKGLLSPMAGGGREPADYS